MFPARAAIDRSSHPGRAHHPHVPRKRGDRIPDDVSGITPQMGAPCGQRSISSARNSPARVPPYVVIPASQVCSGGRPRLPDIRSLACPLGRAYIPPVRVRPGYGHKRAGNKRIGPGGGTRRLHQTPGVAGPRGRNRIDERLKELLCPGELPPLSVQNVQLPMTTVLRWPSLRKQLT